MIKTSNKSCSRVLQSYLVTIHTRKLSYHFDMKLCHFLKILAISWNFTIIWNICPNTTKCADLFSWTCGISFNYCNKFIESWKRKIKIVPEWSNRTWLPSIEENWDIFPTWNSGISRIFFHHFGNWLWIAKCADLFL